jgi:hypothetical protein
VEIRGIEFLANLIVMGT